MFESITVEVFVQAPIEKVWSDFNDPEAIKVWGSADQDWHTTQAVNDLKVGGSFLYRMEAKDKSTGFDFEGVYDEVILHERIAYTMSDGRKVEITFVPSDNGVRIIETFEAEKENPIEMQKEGWQAILNNFKKYVESSI